MNDKITDTIIKKLKVPNLIRLLVDHLSFGELQSLLLRIFELKTAKKDHGKILKEYQSNRFAQPSDINSVVHRNLELRIFSLLPEDFELIELSPLTPIGTTSVLTPIHQNNVVSTIRNMEVAADTTNILALECAKRRNLQLNKDKKNIQTIKLCSSQRLLRSQPFENENFSAHFNVIALCTAGKDEGNDMFETISLEEHILFYVNILDKIIDEKEIKHINVKFFEFGDSDNSGLIENIKNKLNFYKRIHFNIEKNSEFGKNYYSRLRFMLSVVNHSNQEFDYIDGGYTDWTSRLLNNKKERLLTSGIGTDFLLRTVKIKT